MEIWSLYWEGDQGISRHDLDQGEAPQNDTKIVAKYENFHKYYPKKVPKYNIFFFTISPKESGWIWKCNNQIVVYLSMA